MIDKNVLLSSTPDILEEVNDLAFDQRAIIEYQTLVDARFWMGLTMSSMSALIAYARTVNNTEAMSMCFQGAARMDRTGIIRASP